MIRYLAFLLFAAATFSMTSCDYMGGKRVKGNGNSSSQQRSVGNFSGLEVRGGIDVFVSQGSPASLRIEGDENLLQYIEIEEDGDLIKVGTRRGYNLRPRVGLKIYATAPQFTKLYVSGSGNIKSQTRLTTNSNIDARISGSGDIVMELNAPTINASISGSGSIILNGNTRDFNGGIMGSGDIKCYELLSERSSIDIAGSGNAEVYASKELKVDIKGAGDVRYKGSPSINQSIKGSGSVSKAG